MMSKEDLWSWRWGNYPRVAYHQIVVNGIFLSVMVSYLNFSMVRWSFRSVMGNICPWLPGTYKDLDVKACDV